jgi:hypothetical protein
MRKEKPMKTRLTRALAILASSLLLSAGLLISSPANAATYTVSVTIRSNGVLDNGGHLVAYTFDTSDGSWVDVADIGANASGFAQLSLTSGITYRFCYYSNTVSDGESFCNGGDYVAQATSVVLNGPLTLPAVDIHTKQVLDLSRIRIQGKAVAGQRLTVDLSTLPAGVSESQIYWYLDASISGTYVRGQYLGSGSYHLVNAAEAGHTISASVWAAGNRWIAPEDHSSSNPPHLTPAVGPVVLPMGFSSAPKVKANKWKKGNTASYVAPTVTPPGATATFQWLRNGKAIKGAKNSTYKIKQADRKKKLTLRVTYTHSGYETTTTQSPPSPKIK